MHCIIFCFVEGDVEGKDGVLGVLFLGTYCLLAHTSENDKTTLTTDGRS